MTRLRAHKKEKMELMHKHLQRLELQLNQTLAMWNRSASFNDRNKLCGAIHRLALESDALRTENVELFERLQCFERLQSIAHQEILETVHTDDHESANVTMYEASTKAKWTPQSVISGWRVFFPDGAPSFYFHPFTFEEFNRVTKLCDDTFAVDPPFINCVGEMFGWKMHCAPLTRRPDKSLVIHARFTSQFNSSLDSIGDIMRKLGVKSLPLISTPPHWNPNQREELSVNVLQEFEKDSYVVVCNIPGPVHYRFIYFHRQLNRIMINGKRSVAFIMIAANSEANQRTRLEELQHNVNWVQEGGTYVTLTEVDDGTVDMAYDHWGSCQDEQHGQSLFIQWAQLVSRWSQTIMPKLLKSGN
ncbi:hypothetical protein PHMEG_00032393 [Phytophthora megakarya]|uniref:Uncharacterized protein n=1 Tax=Phytophthora megakarya TaxID=4795 RepID=A0A225UY59_9STRA|nr:hypothetical protein PHMEG_00032393 [Phytophthora megakarya]